MLLPLDKLSKILILDDELYAAESLKDDLALLGYRHVTIVTNQEQFTHVILEEDFDLVFLDVKLGADRAGLELAKVLNLKEKVPFIAMSSFKNEANLDLAIQLGSTVNLARNPSLTQLNISIRTALQNPAFHWIYLGENHRRVQKREILCISALTYMSYVHLMDGTRVLCKHGLGQTKEKINYVGLVQCHRSYVVNLDRIHAFSTSKIKLPLPIQINSNPEKKVSSITIGKVYKDTVLKYLGL